MSKSIPLAPIALLLISACALQGQRSTVTVFRDVRVFDGTRMLGPEDVLVRGKQIARTGKHLTAPADATIIDAHGKTLLPGLIDAHTHTWGDAAKTALIFGVTTELDMFTDAAAARTARAEQRAGKATDRADIFSAGTLVTAPHGHGTEYGMAIPTITSPDSAQSFVDARIAEGSDYIKIVYDDGHTYGMSLPTLSKETMRAVIVAAHRRGKLAVVHIGDLAVICSRTVRRMSWLTPLGVCSGEGARSTRSWHGRRGAAVAAIRSRIGNGKYCGWRRMAWRATRSRYRSAFPMEQCGTIYPTRSPSSAPRIA